MTTNLNASPDQSASSKPSRKSTSQRIESARAQKAQIEAKLAALEARQKSDERKRDTRRKIVVGAAVLAHAERDATFRDALKAALRAAVTRDIDKAAIADMLG